MRQFATAVCLAVERLSSGADPPCNSAQIDSLLTLGDAFPRHNFGG